MCFNSRTREGCDASNHMGVLDDIRFQFTHPGGVRLLPLGLTSPPIQSFNSRTREGCDLYANIRPKCSFRFQFTHPGGVRLRASHSRRKSIRVSIHAPGRGATEQAVRSQQHKDGFNSRTREGCDLSPCFHLSSSLLFQFTHPGGVRLQERMRKGQITAVSIHAPGRGATRCYDLVQYGEVTFQFTHPGGVRQYGAKLRIMGRINKRNLRLEVLL